MAYTTRREACPLGEIETWDSAEAQLKIQAAAAGGSKIIVPPKETCEKQSAQFANSGNMPRLMGQREWPALLRLCDKLDPSYRT